MKGGERNSSRGSTLPVAELERGVADTVAKYSALVARVANRTSGVKKRMMTRRNEVLAKDKKREKRNEAMGNMYQ